MRHLRFDDVITPEERICGPEAPQHPFRNALCAALGVAFVSGVFAWVLVGFFA